MSASGGPWSQGGQLVSWLAREHCVRHPEAVAKAWESMTPHAPTLADCGRMFAAYGQSFSVAQLRYIARHPEALILARRVAAGWQYLKFDAALGFVADEGFVVPEPMKLTRSLYLFGIGTFALAALTLHLLWSGNFQRATATAALGGVCMLFTLLEFVELKGMHDARRAIALCSATREKPAATSLSP